VLLAVGSCESLLPAAKALLATLAKLLALEHVPSAAVRAGLSVSRSGSCRPPGAGGLCNVGCHTQHILPTLNHIGQAARTGRSAERRPARRGESRSGARSPSCRRCSREMHTDACHTPHVQAYERLRPTCWMWHARARALAKSISCY